jgi:hypothetical protein
MMGFQFAFTKFYQDLFIANHSSASAVDSSGHKLSKSEEFISATLSGVTVGVFASPVELVMIQQQRFGGSFFTTPSRIIKDHGFFSKGVMRGYTYCAARDAIYVCGMLGITPIVQDYLVEKHDFSIAKASFVASLLGGLFAAVPSHPFDVMKTCMQGDLKQESFQGIRQTAKKLIEEKRLFNGCFWRSINVVGTVYIANECRNYLSPYIQKIDL